MADRHNPTSPDPSALAVRALIRGSRKAVLATLRPPDARPFASLVAVAADPGARPLLLLSGLAVHTRNLTADQRGSLLFDGTGSLGDPLTGPRATLEGRVVPAPEAAAKARFLARHPDAQAYAGFADFGFYRLEAERAHLVQGFGRIIEVSAAALAVGLPSTDADWSGEAAAIVRLQAALDASGSRCVITGLDPDGFDLAEPGAMEWIAFPSLALDPSSAALLATAALVVRGTLPPGTEIPR